MARRIPESKGGSADPLEAMDGRGLRAFKRWMQANGIERSDALELCIQGQGSVSGIGVKALYDLKEGDVIATIPKQLCLTTRTSDACNAIEDARLGGTLGLAVALMYERSRSVHSPFFGYLQLLPHQECVPLVWSIEEVDSLLLGTELHKVVKEDMQLLYEDWKESVLPLSMSDPIAFPKDHFSLDQYFAAKTLVGSRSFEIDNYHGFGMVPLADLFNHKTASEDVHFTCVSEDHDSDSNTTHSMNEEDSLVDFCSAVSNGVYSIADAAVSETSSAQISFTSRGSSDILEMILVKDVKKGNEVFNTYGTLSNAALLHRYGFTEPDNPYDIVNVDFDLVLNALPSLISARQIRACVHLWRKLGFAGCSSHNMEYFEISSDGSPQSDLVMLLYIVCLSDEVYQQLDMTVFQYRNIIEDGRKIVYFTSCGTESTPLDNKQKESYFQGDLKFNTDRSDGKSCIKKRKTEEHAIASDEWLLTTTVCQCLQRIADERDKLYGGRSIEEDRILLADCAHTANPRLFHSLSLRVSERHILKKLKMFASKAQQRLRASKNYP